MGGVGCGLCRCAEEVQVGCLEGEGSEEPPYALLEKCGGEEGLVGIL